MVVTLQQIGLVVKDYIVAKLASNEIGLRRAAMCIAAEVVQGYVVNRGLTLKNDITVGAGVFTEKNNIALDKAAEYLRNAMQQCGPFSITLPFGLPSITIEPSDVDELHNLLNPMAVKE